MLLHITRLNGEDNNMQLSLLNLVRLDASAEERYKGEGRLTYQ